MKERPQLTCADRSERERERNREREKTEITRVHIANREIERDKDH